jgi:hypothetical protein
MDSHATTAMQRCHQDWHHGRRRYRRDNRRGRLQLLASGTVLVFAGLLALTGCTTPGDGNNPGTASPPDTTVATTVPATTTPPPTTAAVYKPATDAGPAENVPIPVLPEKAKEFSKEGLIAFAEYWFSTLGYVFETGDSGPMLAVTEPGCQACDLMINLLEPTYENGGWVVGGQMEVVQSISYFTPLSDGDYQAEVEAMQIKVIYFNADGSMAKELDQHPVATNIVNAHWVDGRWIASKGELLRRD